MRIMQFQQNMQFLTGICHQLATCRRVCFNNSPTRVHLFAIFPVAINGWLYITVVMVWINGRSKYKHLVENWLQKICAKPEITWEHVPTKDYPVGLANSGEDVELIVNCEYWPLAQVIQPSEASTGKVKATNELFKVVIEWCG